MGREVRRVPLDWEHPRDDRGNYIPLYGVDYAAIAARWWEEAVAWHNGTHETLQQRPEFKKDYPYYWEWDTPPDPKRFRPAFTGEPVGYQIYENVTEGTPISPVFASADEGIAWLVGRGYSEHAARKFFEVGWAFSMVVEGREGEPTKVHRDIHMYDRDDSIPDEAHG